MSVVLEWELGYLKKQTLSSVLGRNSSLRTVIFYLISCLTRCTSSCANSNQLQEIYESNIVSRGEVKNVVMNVLALMITGKKISGVLAKILSGVVGAEQLIMGWVAQSCEWKLPPTPKPSC